MVDDMDGVGECHYLMNSIINEITPWKSYIYENKPEFKNLVKIIQN